MKMGRLLTVTMACTMLARADFSYTQTRKSSQGSGAVAEGVTKHYLKGQKMKLDSGKTAAIFDVDAQTMTSINNQAKTYTVTPFSELAKVAAKTETNAKIDVKETGQKKNINGFNASEVLMTVGMEGGPAAAQGMTMQIEMDMWLSSEVPGAKELRAFYQKNGERLPWGAMGGGVNAAMQKAIADMQKKMVSIGGVPVMQITRMKAAGEGARARLEEMKKKGGQQAAMAEQALARLGGGSQFEVTTESSGFSTSAIPDSVFAVPGDYRKVTK
ncbi:MAG: hypothetical protein JWP63_1459 [Candidatus Solibacter sp.]|nr:hypothetical protein [Candidatus Solibacter sp.]